MESALEIISIDYWPVQIPLAQPYHLSSVYGTLTHSDAVILRVHLANGAAGWGEADPGGVKFDGYTLETTCSALAELTPAMLGQNVASWVEQGLGRQHLGAAAAALDVACYDALARVRQQPVWKLLGQKRHDGIDSLWPTSNGSADDDLKVIEQYYQHGFRTYMLKMGDRPIEAEIERTRQVLTDIADDVIIMVDANQGWSLAQASEYVHACNDLPLILLEQPLPADDIAGLSQLCGQTRIPISVDESILRPDQVDEIIKADAADIFSIKISKNGGLANSLTIANSVEQAGKRILMNSMIELGITQAASLHLGCTLDNLMPCGHAYMSTKRMADDVTDFSSWLHNGRAHLSDRPGLGIEVSMEKIKQYQIGEFHVG
ncbi:MAG: hypothetical protein GY952_08790 [Rhodobacteraceae bacterium]|nr:hypothetical protein [Paracoccaceae bacterium]